ncbi:MAG: hypothetical protein J6N70_14290 [Oribacterium sp.]|nr:hypothetical protein [Oribacterium sp.]
MDGAVVFQILSWAAQLATGETLPENFFKFLVFTFSDLADKFGAIIEAMYNIDAGDLGQMDSFFTAAGSVLLTLFFCMEVFTYAASIDLHGGIEGAIRFAMKIVVAQLIIQNTGNICGVVAGVLKKPSADEIKDSLKAIGDVFRDAGTMQAGWEGGVFGMNYLSIDMLMLVVLLVAFVLYLMIALSLMQVVFETAVLTVISPVPLSTLVNSQARSTGIAFIKNYAAVCMQWGVLAVIFKVYKNLAPQLMQHFMVSSWNGGGYGAVLFTYCTPVFTLVILAIMVTKSGDITKRALGG